MRSISAQRILPSPSRCLVFVCAMLWFAPANSQRADPNIPPNSHYTTGDQGWACNQGFTEVGGLCVRESGTLASESAFEVFDGQWRCRPGYHRAGQRCVIGTAPAHAAFTGDGEHWQCDWGFQRTGAQCQEIKPPPHAYIEASGHDWTCFPGYRRDADHCVRASNSGQQADGTTATPAEQTQPH